MNFSVAYYEIKTSSMEEIALWNLQSISRDDHGCKGKRGATLFTNWAFCNINLLHNYTRFFTDPTDPYQIEIMACC